MKIETIHLTSCKANSQAHEYAEKLKILALIDASVNTTGYPGNECNTSASKNIVKQNIPLS